MKNQETANRLRKMDLSRKARNVIESTEIDAMYDEFGHLETAEEVEEYIDYFFSDDFGKED